jgi:hypothetical protein
MLWFVNIRLQLKNANDDGYIVTDGLFIKRSRGGESLVKQLSETAILSYYDKVGFVL